MNNSPTERNAENHLKKVGKVYAGYLLASVVPVAIAGVNTYIRGWRTARETISYMVEGWVVFAMYAFPVAVGLWILIREYGVSE